MIVNRCRYLIVAGALASSALCAQPPAVGNIVEQSADSGHKFTPAQRVEIEARDQLAREIAQNVSADALGRKDSQWQARLLSSLYSVSSPNLRNIAAQARTVDQAHAMAGDAFVSQKSQSISQAKALGDTGDDLAFTPKTPCRFIDTRNVGGVIPKGSPTFTAFDTEKYGSTYGGDASCTLPGSGEIAIAANITVTVDSGAAGFLGIRPFGSTSRSSSLVNWPAGGTTGIANAAIITTAPDTNGHYEFEAYAGGNTPNLIVDYFGFFAPAAATALECTISGMTQLNVIPGGEGFFPTPNCPSGYTVTAVFCDANPPTTLLGSSQYSSVPECDFGNSTASNTTAAMGYRCCRVP